MAYTTASAVEGIIETDEDIVLTDADLLPFIETANHLIEAVCVPLGYTSAQLEMIERWLAAHFYAIRDMRRDTERVGEISEKVQYKVDLNLQVTVYGQQALMLDFKGGLADLQNLVDEGPKVKPSLSWLGNTEIGD